MFNDIDAMADTIPDHPQREGKPVVKFGDPENEPTDVEYIHVVQRVNDDEEAWSRMPGGKDEEVDIRIEIGTYWESVTGLEVLQRLKVITHAIQGIWRDTVTGEYTPPSGVPGAVKLRGFQATDIDCYPDSAFGYVGKATLRLRVMARI